MNTLSTEIVRDNKSAIYSGTFQKRILLIVLRSLAIVLGGLHTWAAMASHSMNPDGVAYMYMGEAYIRGDWGSALNSYWSPLYSWAIGLALRLFNPSMDWEFPLIHITNFLIYLITLLCFEFFWRRLRKFHLLIQGATDKDDNILIIPEWAWWGLGYMFFIWSSLNLIRVWAVTPDMVVAAVVYLAAGILMNIQSGTKSWQNFALLGAILGFGYLAKAAMFPMAFVFMGVSLFSLGNLRRALSLGLVAVLSFFLIGGPFIAALSSAKGHLTFGDAGKLMYAWHINDIPYPHWQGEVPDGGVPEHPTRKILDNPTVYEFGTPIEGTYPVSYDPTYWYEGVLPHFELKGQIRVLWLSTQYYFDIFFRQLGGLLIGFLILYIVGRSQRSSVIDIVRRWSTVLIALIAFAMFALVHVQSRYIGAFVILFLAGLLVNVQLRETQISKRLINVVGLAMILIMLINIVAFNFEGISKLTGITNTSQFVGQQARAPSWPGEVAETLQQYDVMPGDEVAVIGYAFDSFWARLAHVRIVAEVLGWQAGDFWLADPILQSEVIQAFASTGAEAIVAENVPAYANLRGWHQVGNSDYYVYLLNE